MNDRTEFQERLKLASNGSAQNQCRLGWMYANGEGVGKNDAEATKWYRRAAEQGHAQGQYNLGVRYWNGRGVEKNTSEAAVWYRRAAEQGYAPAQHNLGWAYGTGEGVAQNYAEAFKWFRKAAEQGLANSQFHLGVMYQAGAGIEQNTAEAVKWYRKAADQGYAAAQNRLGWAYEVGRGVEKDDAEAVKWFRKAAEQGHESAQTNLALMFENGRGTAKDGEEASFWFDKAASNGEGYALARNLLEEGEPKSEVKIVELCARTIEEGAPELCLLVLSARRLLTSVLDRVMERIHSMIGLERVKEEIDNLIAVARLQLLRRAAGLPETSMTLHLAFTGNPGTGKTTVAREVGIIYAALGFLKKGHLLEVHRQDLVAEYIGQTAPKTKAKVAEALGGVLFLDEAYSLAPGDSFRDFGLEAIATLIAEMENKRDEFAVIVAGYTDEMNHFLDQNPGMKSRINMYIHFDDYNPEELCRIFLAMAEQRGYIAGAEVMTAVEAHVRSAWERRGRDFGNARFVRNLLENAIKRLAVRIMRREPLGDRNAPLKSDLENRDVLCTLKPEDIPAEHQ